MRVRGVFNWAAMVITALVLVPSLSFAQCYTVSSDLSNLCTGGTTDEGFSTQAALRNMVVSAGATRYLFYAYPNTVDVFNLNTPMTPTRLNPVTVQLPWFQTDGGTGGGLTDHISGLATLDGFPYMMIGLYTWGWDFFKLDPSNPRFLGAGYNPGYTLQSGDAYTNEAMFWHNGGVYLVGQLLDKASIDASDRSIKIFQIYDGATLTPETLVVDRSTPPKQEPVLPFAARVPIGKRGDVAPYSSFPLNSLSDIKYFVYQVGSTRYLIVRAGPTAVVVDISDPTNLLSPPKPVAQWTDTRLFEGDWALDRARATLYVSTSKDSIVYAFDVSTPTPVYRGTYRWATGIPLPLSYAQLSLSGDLLSVTNGWFAGYLNVAAATGPTLVTPQAGFTTITRNCPRKTTFGPTFQVLTPFAAGGQQYVAESLGFWGNILQIASACMTTIPQPSLSVSTTAPVGPDCTGGDARGYPGDTFTVTNTSLGSWTNPVLTVTGPAQAVSPSTWITGTGPAYTFSPPATALPGLYTFDLAVTDPSTSIVYKASTAMPPTTKTVSLCGTPHANAKIIKVGTSACTSCTFLTGNTVTLSAMNPSSTGVAISQGHPSRYDWIFLFPSGNASSSVNEYDLLLALQGTYTAKVVAHYDFPGTVDPKCAGLGLPLQATNYDSCATLAIPSLPFSVGNLTVTPNCTTPTTAQCLVLQPITVQANYQVGPGWTPTFLWTIDGVSDTAPIVGVTGGSGVVQRTIPAGTWSTIGNHPIALGNSATNGTQTVSVLPYPSATLYVTTSIGTFSASPNPVSVGTDVTFSLTNLATVPTKVDFNFGAAGCKTAQSVSCDNVMLGRICETFTFAGGYSTAGGPYTVSATLYNGATVLGTLSTTVTVTAGSCAGPPPPPPPPPPPGCTPATAPTANFTFSPAQPLAGQPVQFTDASTGSPTSWSWDLGIGGCGALGLGCPTDQNPTFTYQTPGIYQVTLTATNCKGSSAPVTKTITVAVACDKPVAPTAAFTYSPLAPRAGQQVAFTDTSTGTPTSWAWTFTTGGIGVGSSSAQSPTFTFPGAGAYTVTLTASNCRGPNTYQVNLQVAPACAASGPPVANFDWTPQGPLPSYPAQQQPYVGQQVTLIDTSTNSPSSWNWYDFQTDPGQHFTTQSPAFAWNSPGPKNVRLIATNCAGSSGETAKAVTIYPDIRPVTADFTMSPDPAQTGTEIAFTAITGSGAGDPTVFNWTFGDDGSTPSGQTVKHTFACSGNVKVTLTSKRGDLSGTTTKTLVVGGKFCGPESIVVPDAAKLPGQFQSYWHTDCRIFNPSSQTSQVWLAVLPVDTDNALPFTAGPYVLAPKATQVLQNVLQLFEVLGKSYTKAALRFTYSNADSTAPVVYCRTYTDSPTGGSFGQFVPSEPVIANTTPSPLWITGVRTDADFRTNMSFTNLRADPNVRGIGLTLFDSTGAQVTSKTLDLPPYGYVQKSLGNLLGIVLNPGVFAIKLNLPTGADVQVGATLVDNHTNDTAFIEGKAVASTPLFVPAIGRTPGELGTLWRADVQITNADSAAHTWELKYLPGGGKPGSFRNFSLGPLQTMLLKDFVAWIYDNPNPADSSGMLRIAPADGSNVLPVVAGRSYNSTALGTYGQDIPPFTAGQGASVGGKYARLLITGMSSQDIARTNLGFMNLSDTSIVDFAVYFYDESGKMLNPGGAPFTIALPVGGWDQRKLENRFRDFFGVDLPANQRAISAEIRVRNGGPGFAYATVIDNLTGDPVFAPAQLAP